jgi:hypothetical protein
VPAGKEQGTAVKVKVPGAWEEQGARFAAADLSKDKEEVRGSSATLLNTGHHTTI